jgi:arylsulfatase A-like enzyme
VNHWRLDGGSVSAFVGPRPGAEAAADWIRERGRRGPFFLFFHTFGAHEYYLATDAMRAGADRWAGDYEGWLRATSLRFGSKRPQSAEELRYLVALYDAGIRASDEALGLLLRALEETGLDENTLVVVTSDHGEGFRPDLERTWHLGRLHDDLLRVPLVVRMPGRIPEGLRIESQVSGVDLLPTALDLLGVATPEGVRGQSVASLLEGRPAPGLREAAYSQVADHDPDRQGTSVRSRGFKLIHKLRSDEELYDLRADPEETNNLASRPLPVASRMRQQLERFEREVSQETPELDDAMEEQLRALGYVE